MRKTVTDEKGFFERNLYSTPSIGIYPPKNFPSHYHKHVEFILIKKGCLSVTVDGVTELLSEGDTAIIFPYRIHEYKLYGECNRYIAVFEPEFFGELSQIFMAYKPITPYVFKDELCGFEKELSYLLSQISAMNDKNPTACAVYLAKLGLLLAGLMKTVGVVKLPKESDTPYFHAIKHCCDNFTDENLSALSVAETLHISVSRLQHIFSENIGCGIKEYVNTLRIDFAEKLLVNTKLSITEIGLRSGFSSLRTFNRVFLKKNGVSPGAYREGAAELR